MLKQLTNQMQQLLETNTRLIEEIFVAQVTFNKLFNAKQQEIQHNLDKIHELSLKLRNE